LYVIKLEDIPGMYSLWHGLKEICQRLIFQSLYKQIVMQVGVCVPLAQFLLSFTLYCMNCVRFADHF
jgi:hypothetical protein